jgi:hypothetical protein
VANNLLEAEWIELPQITPDHLRAARKIKRYFSGQLDKSVLSEPAFPGFEKHYLKAQLVRITHSLELTPKGIFKPNDENPKIVEYEEEPKVPEFAELSALESWTHRNQNVLNVLPPPRSLAGVRTTSTPPSPRTRSRQPLPNWQKRTQK